MSRKARQLMTMVALLIALIAAGLGYYAVIRYQASHDQKTSDTKEASSDEDALTLYSTKKKQINKLSVQTAKASMTFVKEGGDWTLESDQDFPVDTAKVDTMLDDTATITATKLVTENCADLSEYQLDTPELMITFETKAGESHSLVIGMEGIAAGGRYAYLDDSSKIYVVNTTIFSDFDFSQRQMMKVEAAPSITAAYVTGLSITAKKGDSFQAVYDPKHAKYRDIDSWDITKPFTQTVAGDKNQLATLFGTYTGVSYEEGVTYHASSAQLKKYGLASPVYTATVDYFTVKGQAPEDEVQDADQVAETKKLAKKYVLKVGKKTDAGDSYYVQPGSSKAVYLMSADTVDSMVKLQAKDYVYSKFYVGDETKLKGVDLTYQGKDYSMKLTKKKATADTTDDTNGGETYTYTAKIDGAKVDDQSFRNAYAAFSQLTISSVIDPSVKPTSNHAIGSITFHETNRDVKMTFYPYDGSNFYRVDVDGVTQFVTDLQKIDSALQDFVKLAK